MRRLKVLNLLNSLGGRSRTITIATLSCLVSGGLLLFLGSRLSLFADNGADKATITALLQKYESFKQSNNKISICTQADVVASAYLDAHDSAKHAEWEAIKEKDCDAAGVPYY